MQTGCVVGLAGPWLHVQQSTDVVGEWAEEIVPPLHLFSVPLHFK